MGDWNLDVVADRLQTAALDHTLWPDVLADLSRRVGGAGALLFSGETRQPGLAVSPDLARMFEDYTRDGWVERDERRRALPTILDRGVGVDQDFASADDMRRSDYYQDFLARHGRQWFAGIGFRANHDLWILSIQRSIAQGPFEPAEVERLATLCRPLNDAATLSRQLAFARLLGIADGLELLAQPCVLLDDRGRVLTINDSAERLVGDMVDILHRTLEFSDSMSRSSYHALLADTLSGRISGPKPSITLARNRAGQKLSVRMIALRGLARFTFTGAKVMLLFGLPASGELLRSSYGLTRSEARLALSLAEGKSVAQTAEAFGITYETARSQLRSAFFKTSTNRQGELVALVNRLSSRPFV